MSKAVGIGRDLKVVRRLRAEGWAAFTAKNDGLERDGKSGQGPVDVVASRPGRLWVIQVKSTTSGPFHSFGPAKRAELAAEARLAGAEAFVCFWPPRAREPRWIAERDWPVVSVARAA